MKSTMLPEINLFLWISEFNSNEPSMSSLLQCMKQIISNISSSVNDCYEKPSKAAKLKESIKQALIWILLSYRKLPKNENSSAYLESMSDLLAMYVDMELRASKRGQEQFSAISSRLICCLYVFLESSIEHMLNTLIKLRHMNHQFCIILDPVMMKILNSIPTRPKTEIMYVRYLLAFRLWRMINSDLAVKKQIRQTAVSLLGSPPSTLPDFLLKYIQSNGSGSQIKSTQFFMKNKFDVRACCADFLQFCEGKDAQSNSIYEDKINCPEGNQDFLQQKVLENIIAEESSSIIKSNSFLSEKVSDLKSSENIVQNKPHLSSNSNKFSINDFNDYSIKTPKLMVRPKVRKSSDIIIIDITNEIEAPKITRKKIRKSFPWMKTLKRKNPEIMEKRKIPQSNSPAKEILESLILVTEDSEQKKTELDLFSTFESWIIHDLEPTSDICKFFNEEVNDANINSPPQIEEIQVSRFENCKIPPEADSMISNSNEILGQLDLESRDACEKRSITVFSEHDLESNAINCSKDMNYMLDPNIPSDKRLCQIEVTQFQENADALSVLATVCAAQKGNSPSKLIKVKDYAHLRHPSNNEIDPKTSYQFSESATPDVINRILNIYPEDVFDKVGLQVEVISTSDELTTENISQSFKDTSNTILNGETVVLKKKSPNSNVYVINKESDGERELSQEVLNSESLTTSFGLMVKAEFDEKILRSSSVEDLKKSSTDVNITRDRRKNHSGDNLSCIQNVKQEYGVSCTCGISGCLMLSHDLTNPQIPLHMPANHSASHYGDFSSAPEHYGPYLKHCSSVPRSLPVSSPTKHSHTTKNSACGRSHCSCLACTYEVVSHCRQYVHPTSESHSSYIEDNSYFLPQHSTVQTSAVEELEMTKDPRTANLYEDQLLCNIENSNSLKSKPLENINIQFNPEVKYQLEHNNKLPLKKRLKAFNGLQKPYDLSIKMEKSNNYPGTPMMSIANLEVQGASSVLDPPEIGATIELTTAKDDSLPIENHHYPGEIVERDYRKDIRESSEDQRRWVNSQMSNVPLNNDSSYQRDINTPLPRNEGEVSSLKRLSTVTIPQEKPAKVPKTLTRQTRSSLRKVPKVNYSYADVDPEWNPSRDAKRKKKRNTSR